MKPLEKRILLAIGVLSLTFGISPVAYGMHIMEGYLSPKFCVAWGQLVFPSLSLDI